MTDAHEILIPKGDQWPIHRWRRTFWRGLTTDRSHAMTWMISEDAPRCTLKLWGLSDVRASLYRVQRYGWGQLLSLSHESSDRFIATIRGDGVAAIRAYAYRLGIGGISPRQDRDVLPPLLRRIGVVPLGQPFGMKIEVERHRTVYHVTTDEAQTSQTIERYLPLPHAYAKAYCHAAGVPSQRGAPEDVRMWARVTA